MNEPAQAQPTAHSRLPPRSNSLSPQTVPDSTNDTVRLTAAILISRAEIRNVSIH